MDKRPELGEVILEGCASEDETVLRRQPLKGCSDIGFFILDFMTFVEDDVTPDESATEPLFLTLKYFVAGDDQIIPSIVHPIFSAFQSKHLPTLRNPFKSIPFLKRPVKTERTEMRRPFPAFVHPGRDDRERADNKEWALMARRVWLVGSEIGEEGEGLKCFSETHFIAEDASGAIVIEPEKERETGELVALHYCGYPVLGLV